MNKSVKFKCVYNPTPDLKIASWQMTTGNEAQRSDRFDAVIESNAADCFTQDNPVASHRNLSRWKFSREHILARTCTLCSLFAILMLTQQPEL
jgi:hypothetical protein